MGVCVDVFVHMDQIVEMFISYNDATAKIETINDGNNKNENK